jgi:hypothetical protein
MTFNFLERPTVIIVVLSVSGNANSMVISFISDLAANLTTVFKIPRDEVRYCF